MRPRSLFLLLALVPAFLGRCSNDTGCVATLVRDNRSELEEARASGQLDEKLTALGLRPRMLAAAAAVLERLPRFDNATGAPLNAAAIQLLTAAHQSRRHVIEERSHLRVADYAAARIALGTWKYVLLEVEDSAGVRAALVRNTAGLQYHAEMAAEARKELHGLLSVRVLGGGWIAFSGKPRTIHIWGYSKTYGRCGECNRRAAALIGASTVYAQYRVTWSNEGY